MSAGASPYVGPRAFRRDEALHGRDREKRDLLNLLIAERILLLYSPSGAGKSSIINAGLVPELITEEFRVLPVVRVGAPPPPGFAGNRYVHSAVAALDDALQERESAPDPDASTDLAAALAAVAPPGGERTVLILDQFEEILTADAADDGARADFFRQLGQALKRSDLWALIAMREDYIAGLDGYADLIPSRLVTRYRLELLGPEAAAEALQRPAAAAGVTFEPEAAKKLVDNLRQVRSSEGEAPRLGPFVEPVHLQIAGLQLWQRMQAQWQAAGTEAGARRIGVDDIHPEDDVDQALGAYYDARLAAIAADGADGEAALAIERRIRDWFDQRLITPEGVRTQVLRGSAESKEVGESVIAHLRDDYLIRTDDRRSAVWYELAHDRLVKPVRSSNDAWFSAHFSPFRLQAITWNRVRGSDLLFTGELLTDADNWVELHPGRVGPVEQEFLDACRKARSDLRRWKHLRFALFAVMAALVVATLIILALVNSARADAVQARIEAQRDRIVAQQAAIRSARQLAEIHRAKSDLRNLRLLIDDERARQATERSGQDQKIRRLEERAAALAADIARREASIGQLTQSHQRMVDDVRRAAQGSTDIQVRERILAATGLAPTLTTSQRRLRDANFAARDTIARTRPPGSVALARTGNPWGLKLWAPGSVLRVRFLDGAPVLRQRVLAAARTWTQYANLSLVESDAPDAEIRITFEGNGSWSFVGTDSLGVPLNQPTMTLGYEDDPRFPEDAFRQAVLHEFGHALGLIHELQNPNANIPWDTQAVYAALGGPPNNWSRNVIDSTVLRVADLPRYRAFDPHSIMLIGNFSRNYFTRPFEMSQGTDLSDSDKSFIAELYPR